ncbi:MAG: CvpA family protein [Flavobacteriales bacterium]|nr:CvpA family protein [Flavobacteriales bacterium]
MNNLFDIVLIIPIVLALVKGYRKGLIIEVASLIALFLGVIVGLKYSGYAGNQLRTVGLDTDYNEIVGFICLLVVVIIGVHLIAKFIEGFVKMIFLGFANNLLGSIFAALKMGLIVSLIVFVMHALDKRTQFLDEEFKAQSRLYMPMVNFVQMAIPFIQELTKNRSEDPPLEEGEVIT